MGLNIPLICERVAPNRWYGFRVRRTLRDPKVWYPVNVYAAWRMLWVGVAEIVVATALYFVSGLDVGAYASMVGGVVIAGLLIGLVQSFGYLRRLTKEKTIAERRA